MIECFKKIVFIVEKEISEGTSDIKVFSRIVYPHFECFVDNSDIIVGNIFEYYNNIIWIFNIVKMLLFMKLCWDSHLEAEIFSKLLLF